jgi:hypothetical protein
MSFFSKSLLKLVETKLMPRLAPLGYRVVEHEKGESFDNASVLIDGPTFHMRIIRERGQLFVDFGSFSEPGQWFDSTVVMGVLGLRGGDGWHSTDADTVLGELAVFVRENEASLKGLFEPSRFSESKGRLLAVREQQSVDRWG